MTKPISDYPIPDGILHSWPEDNDDDLPDILEVMRAIGPKRVQDGRCIHLGCSARAARTGITCGKRECLDYLAGLPWELSVRLMEEKALVAPPWWSSSLLAAGVAMLVVTAGMALVRLASAV